MDLPIALDDIVKTFVSVHDNIPLHKLHYEDGFVIASDAYTLIKVPERYMDSLPDPVEKFPNWKAIIPPLSELPIAVTLLSDLIELKASIPVEPWYLDCDECEGEGRHLCSCGDEHECHECDGTGDGVMAGKRVNYENHQVLVCGVRMNANLLYRLIPLHKELNLDKINWHYVENKTIALMAGEVLVLMMGLKGEDHDPQIHILKSTLENA